MLQVGISPTLAGLTAEAGNWGLRDGVGEAAWGAKGNPLVMSCRKILTHSWGLWECLQIRD